MAHRPTEWLKVTAGLLLVMACAWACVHTTEVYAKITHHSWARVQRTEVFRTNIAREGWDHPSDAYNIVSRRKIHHYDKVVDHYETEPVYSTRRVQTGTEAVYSTRTVNLGNGCFSTERYQSGTRPVYSSERYQSGTRQVPKYRDEPVYRTYYSYRVDRWVTGPDRKTASKGLEPKWPPTHVSDPSLERMSSRQGTYWLHFKEIDPPKNEKPRTFQSSLAEKAWRTWDNGETVILEINVAGGVRSFRRPEVEGDS